MDAKQLAKLIVVVALAIVTLMLTFQCLVLTTQVIFGADPALWKYLLVTLLSPLAVPAAVLVQLIVYHDWHLLAVTLGVGFASQSADMVGKLGTAEDRMSHPGANGSG
jgi:hypothetical protein